MAMTNITFEGKRLTSRHMDILYRLKKGESNKQIGNALSISPLTIKNHMVKLFEIFGTRDRGQVVIRAMEKGILTLDKKSDDIGTTHFPGCWKKHHGCATARLDDVQKELMELRSKVDRLLETL